MLKVSFAVAAVVFALSALWYAGETHRRGCTSEGKVSCSVLPWDYGERPPPPPGPPARELTEEEKLLCGIEAYADRNVCP